MPPRTWAEMRESITAMLVRDTGHDVAWWNEQMAAQPSVEVESAPQDWLTERGVTGYKQMLLVMERFGYPEYPLASADAADPGAAFTIEVAILRTNAELECVEAAEERAGQRLAELTAAPSGSGKAEVSDAPARRGRRRAG